MTPEQKRAQAELEAKVMLEAMTTAGRALEVLTPEHRDRVLRSLCVLWGVRPND